MAATAVGLAARGIATVGSRYAPVVIDKANDLLKKVTSGRVKNVTDVVPYVGGSPERLAVVARAVANAGVAPDDILPADLVGTNDQLSKIRDSIVRVVMQQRDAYDAGTQDRLKQMGNATDAAGDVLKKNAVEAVYRVYGSEDAYFLCHPNGGVPREWFGWYKSLFGRRRG